MVTVTVTVMVVVWGLRRLDGQVYSFDTANSLGILPGSRGVRHDIVDETNNDVVKGLVLLEGYLPPYQSFELHSVRSDTSKALKPSMHHFVHYGEYVTGLVFISPQWCHSDGNVVGNQRE